MHAVVWETVACPLCGARRESELLVVPGDAGDTYRLVRCDACGLGYLNPRPDAASIGRFYPDDYSVYHSGQDAAQAHAPGPLGRLALAWRYGYPTPPLPWYWRLLGPLAGLFAGPAADSFTALPFTGTGRLLDVGCGSGWYAARMQALGWEVVGLDFSAFAAAQATRRYGIRTLVGSLPHPEIEPGSFDAVTMGMVLEHVHDPHRTLAAAVAALRPGGLLALAVPNFDSWGCALFGADWWGMQLPLHLLHFTAGTLRRLVEDHGLEVRQCRPIARRSWLVKSAKAAHARRAPAARTLLGRLARCRPVASLLTRWADWTGRADSLFLLAQRPAVTAPAGRTTGGARRGVAETAPTVPA